MRDYAEGIIYKIIKYSDNSAIANAYTLEHGKVKLFIPKAYSKSGGISLFTPGELDMQKKEKSELNKLYHFKPYYNYTYFAETPAISIRLSLLFDIYDSLYEVSQEEPVLWTILSKITTDNISKVLMFAIFAMLKNNGHMFNIHECATCGKELTTSAKLHEGMLLCDECAEEGGLQLSEFTLMIFKAFQKPSLYNSLKISRAEEIKALSVLVNQVETAIDRKLVSYKTFKELIVCV